MKDFIGNELQLGDAVAVTRKPYHAMEVKYVIGFTPKAVKVSKTKGRNPEDGTMPYKRQYITKLFNQ